jgi:hypothetical protein
MKDYKMMKICKYKNNTIYISEGKYYVSYKGQSPIHFGYKDLITIKERIDEDPLCAKTEGWFDPYNDNQKDYKC